MVAHPIPPARQSFRDADGTPLVAGTVEFYVPATSTLIDTYRDPAGAVPNTHPIVLDARGEAAIYGNGSMRQVLRDALGNLIWDQITDTLPSVAAPNTSSTYYPVGLDTNISDNSPAIQAAIVAAGRAGGGSVVLPAGDYKIASTLMMTKSNVRLIGAGRGGPHDVEPLSPAGTRLIWTGNNAGTMVACEALPGGQKLTDMEVSGVCLVSGMFPYTTSAGYGLLVSSVQQSLFDVFTVEFSIAAMAMTVTSGMAEAANCEANTVSLRFRQINTAGTALQLGGDASGNTCHNLFMQVYGYINNGIGIDAQNADNNLFDLLWIDRLSGGTGITLFWRGTGGPRAGNTAGMGGGRTNTIQHLSGSIHPCLIFSEGTETIGVTSPAFGNRVEYFDFANAVPVVLTGTGASFYYGSNTQATGIRTSSFLPSVGYVTLGNGLILFWGVVGTAMIAGQVAVITVPGPVAKVLDASAQMSNGTTGGAASCTWAATGPTFSLRVQDAGTYSYRGYALTV